MADSSIKVSLEFIDAAAQKALSDMISKSDAIDKGLGKVKESGTSAFSEIGLHISKASGFYDIFAGNLAANVAIKGIELLTDAAKELFNTFVTEGIKSAADYQVALQTLNVALAGSGNYSGEASKGLVEFADKIQETTKYSNVAVLQNTALLESLSGLDENGLKRASKAAIELASGLQIDLTTAFNLVGKASEGNVTALTKHGIAVTEGANKAETFANALKLIEGRFGSAAEGEVLTYAGAVTQAGHSFEEVQKSIGNVIVQNPAIIAGISALSAVFTDTSHSIDGSKNGLRELVANGFIFVIDSATLVVASLDQIVRGADALYAGFKVTFNGLAALMVAPFAYFSSAAKEAFNHFTDEALAASKEVNNAFTKSTGLESVGVALSSISEKATAAFGTMKTGADGTVAPVNGSKRSVDELNKAMNDTEKSALSLSDSLTKQAGDNKKSFEQTTKDLKTELDKQKALNNQAYAEHKISLTQRDAADKKAEDQFTQDEAKAISQKYQDQQAQLDLALSKNLISKDTYNANVKQLQKDEVSEFTAFNNEQTAVAAKANKQQADDKQKQLETEQGYVRDTLGGFSSLMQTSSRELFAIGKAAALANATINTYEAVTKTMAFTPYPFNIPLAIAQGVAGAVQVANIASQNPSFESGGIVPGNSFSGDKIQANVNSGEMILNRQQQAQLFAQANGGGGSQGNQITQMLSLMSQLLSQPVVAQIDGKQFMNITRDQLRAGRSFA